MIVQQLKDEGKELHLYNSLSGTKEKFVPVNDNTVGMYVCGPTVYSDVHLGNCMTFTRFDLIYRYLKAYGYKVRYVRNITDVGHLLDGGEDRISKGARLNQLQPMEVVQKYTVDFHEMMRIFNVSPPSIEPRATGHIIEQIDMVKSIIENGFAYESNGSVYFDTSKYIAEKHPYGELSGRKVDELLTETRDLKNQKEKRNSADFAIWMKASEDHLMKWESPWSLGFPGWHLECSAMSTKYLGEKFDIHGGGNDLKFPHHENEIAQNVASCGCSPAKYWMHTNMLLMHGRKMSKSDGNTITPIQLLTGESEHISQAYSPMSLRFFMLQSHYRSTLDLTDEILKASDKGYKRIIEAYEQLFKLTSNVEKGEADEFITDELRNIHLHMMDDFNSPRAIASLFEIVSKINIHKSDEKNKTIGVEMLKTLQLELKIFVEDVLGIKGEQSTDNSAEVVDGLMELILDLRSGIRANKDWTNADKIRNALSELSIKVKDGKDGTEWSYE